jgi:hypothetical protein
VCSHESVLCRAYFSYGPTWNYIYSCTTKPSDILKVQNALEHSANYVTEYTICKLVLLLSGSLRFSPHSRHLTNLPPHPTPKRKRTAISSQFFCLNFHCLSDKQQCLTNPHNCIINSSRYNWVDTLSWGWRISRTLLLLLFKTRGFFYIILI